MSAPLPLIKYDVDDILAYTTPRLVIIRDRHLGLLSYLFQLSVLVYIVVYEVMYSKNYLSCERAQSNVLFEMHWSDGLTDDECAFLGFTRESHRKTDVEDIVEQLAWRNCEVNGAVVSGKAPTTEEGIDSIAQSTTCEYVEAAKLASSSSINYLKVPMVKVNENLLTEEFTLYYVKEVERAIAQFKMTLESSFYQTSKAEKYGGSAEKIHFKLVDTEGRIVRKCGSQDSFSGFGEPYWDILQSCADMNITQFDCVSEYGSDLLLPLEAMLEAADVGLDEKLADHVARTNEQRLLDSCKHRIHAYGNYGWVTRDTWESLQSLQSYYNTTKTNTYPRFANLAFLGRRYEDIINLSYDEWTAVLDNFCESATLRQLGVVLSISMTHDNMQGSRGRSGPPFVPSTIHTTIKAHAELDQFIGQRPVLTDDVLSTRAFTNDLTVVVGHFGEICKFEFSVLLTTLTSSLGLLMTAKFVVDTIMVTVMPLKKLYWEEKYHTTKDYSELRDRLEKSSQEGDPGKQTALDSVVAYKQRNGLNNQQEQDDVKVPGEVDCDSL